MRFTLRVVWDYLSSNDIGIYQGDYELSSISRGSFVYFDSPYDRFSRSLSFTGNTCVGFDKDEHKRLKMLCDDLDIKVVKFLLSNSSTDFIRDLYKGYEIVKIGAKRVIN